MPLNAIGIGVKSAVASADQTLKDARRAIATADRALSNADATLFAQDSPAPQDLRDALQEVTRAARAVRVLVDYLERHPEILIRGKTEEKK